MVFFNELRPYLIFTCRSGFSPLGIGINIRPYATIISTSRSNRSGRISLHSGSFSILCRVCIPFRLLMKFPFIKEKVIRVTVIIRIYSIILYHVLRIIYQKLNWSNYFWFPKSSMGQKQKMPLILTYLNSGGYSVLY